MAKSIIKNAKIKGISVILVMLFLGVLIVLGQGSAVAPFIYTIF